MKKLTNNKAHPSVPVKPQQGVIDIVIDCGNSIVKAMIHGRRNSVVEFPHAIRRTDAATFNGIVARHSRGLNRNIDVDSSVFEYAGQYVTVGENALLNGEEARSGGPKYRDDYYPILFLGALLKLLPNGHENLRVMALFPPGDHRFIETMMNSLGKKHTVTRANGAKVVYKVREVLTCDEPVGGLRNFLLASDGLHYSFSNIDPGLALCVDIGGKISSLVPFRANGFVDYEQAQSVDLGIQDVMSGVGRVLLSMPEYDSFFSEYRGSELPHDEAMRDCLRTGFYPAGGYDIPALDAIADATEAIRRQIKDVYEKRLGGQRAYRYITVTGGGGGLLYHQLVEHVLNFNPDKIFLCHDDLDTMHYANMFGADKVLAGLLSRESKNGRQSK